MAGWTKRGRRRIRASAVACASLVVAAALLASGASGSHGNTKAALGVLIMRNAQDWNTLDYSVDLGRATNLAYVSPGYDKLISFSPKGGNNYLPYLATKWTQTAKSVTFSLRNDAKCSDGHVLTPVDILNSVKRHLFVPKRSGSTVITTAGGFGQGPYHLHASNKNGTFTISVEKPWALLLGVFAQLPIVCPFGLNALQQDPHYLETHIAGSGPYTLVSAEHGNGITWKRNDGWKWGPPGTNVKNLPETLIYKTITDDTTAANLLLTGGLTVAVVFGPDVQRLNASNLTHVSVPVYNNLWLSYNQAPGKLLRDDEPVRFAIQTAIDPVKVNQTAYGGAGTVGRTIFRPGAPCYDASLETTMPKPDIDKAKQILQNDGWILQPDGSRVKNGQTLKLTLVTTTLLQDLPAYAQQTLTSIGIQVDFQNMQNSAYGAAVLAGRFDVTFMRSVVIPPDPGAGQSSTVGQPAPAGFNSASAGTQDATLQRLENAAYENPGKGGCKYWTLVSKMIQDHAYVTPTVYANLDLYAPHGISVPPFSPDSSAFPVYFIHPQGH
jgi:peptide/nickel transport system substrate-binding protein